jgi:WD40 repeat protein
MLHPSGESLIYLHTYASSLPVVEVQFSKSDPKLFYVLLDHGLAKSGSSFGVELQVCRARVGTDSSAAKGSASPKTTAPLSSSNTAHTLRQVSFRSHAALCTFGVSPDDRYVLFAGVDGRLTLVSLQAEGQRPIHTLSAVRDAVSVSWHPSNQLVAVVSRKGLMQCFDLALQPLWMALADENSEPALVFELQSLNVGYSGVAACQWVPVMPAGGRHATAGSTSSSADSGAASDGGPSASANVGAGGLGSNILMLLCSGGAPVAIHLYTPIGTYYALSLSSMFVSDRLRLGEVRAGGRRGEGWRQSRQIMG